jgi:hypothetical protein
MKRILRRRPVPWVKLRDLDYKALVLLCKFEVFDRAERLMRGRKVGVMHVIEIKP